MVNSSYSLLPIGKFFFCKLYLIEVLSVHITEEASKFLQKLMVKRNKSGVRIGYNEKSM